MVSYSDNLYVILANKDINRTCFIFISGLNRILSSLKFKKIQRAKEHSHIELLRIKGEIYSNRFLFYWNTNKLLYLKVCLI